MNLPPSIIRRTAVVLLLAAARIDAGAATVTLSPVADTSIARDFPGNNLGADTTLVAGTRRDGGPTRALIRFDLEGALPTNARISSVSVSLDVVGTPSGGVNSSFQLHQVLRPWGEGSKVSLLGTLGAPATPGECTWTESQSGQVNWSTAGGGPAADYVAAASASVSISANGRYVFGPTDALLADLRAWIASPASNHGWICRSTAEATPASIRRFGSREDGGATAPVVTVVYEVALPRIDQILRTGDEIQLTFQAQANRRYRIESQAEVGPGTWTTLTNLAPISSDGPIAIRRPLLSGQHFFRLVEE